MAKKDVSISSLWRQLEFVCGAAGDNEICNTPLELSMNGRQVNYVCPKCGQSHSSYDVEKFVDKVTAIIVEDAEDGCATNLSNYKHKLISRYDSKQHLFQVLSHTNSKMKVSIKYV